MARVNVGVPPCLLFDQWLVAESVEITMIGGSLRANQYAIKGKIPNSFKLGAGHVNFFKPKLKYLKRRLDAVNREMESRGFKPGTDLCLSQFPNEFHNDWQPCLEDSMILRNRLIEKINKKPTFWRYKRKQVIEDIDKWKSAITNGLLFCV